jgi:hypothetical protein
VRADSTAVVGARVLVGPVSALTRSDGSFAIHAIAPGVVSISITRDGFTDIRLPLLTIRAGDALFVGATMVQPTALQPVAPGIIIHALPVAPYPVVAVDGYLIGRGDSLPDLSRFRIARIETVTGIRPLELYGRIATGGLILATTRDPR